MAWRAISEMIVRHESGLPEIAAQFPAYKDQVSYRQRRSEMAQRAISDVVVPGSTMAFIGWIGSIPLESLP